MGAHDAPHWLLSAFVRSLTALGATAPREQIEATGKQLLERWCTEDRHHHGITHLVAVLERVDALAQETHNPEIVRVAAWYHGAVFDTRFLNRRLRVAGENKPASAALARKELLELGVPDRTAQRVHDLVMNLTRHDSDPLDVDGMALCDADLGTLAVDPQRYKAYRKHVREEYAHIPARDYIEARIAIISRLLARRNIFTSPLASAWEESARQNLSAELVKLKSELATLPPREDDDDLDEALRDMEPQVVAPVRVTSAKFGREQGPSTIPAVQAVADQRPGAVPVPPDDPAYHPVPSMVPIAAPSVSTPTLPEEADDAEDAEVVGVPFEDRAPARTKSADLEITSAMERVPQSFRDVPRRESPANASAPSPAASSPSAASPSAASPSAASPSAASPSAASPATAPRPSTRPGDDKESTGTLFRPPER